MSKTCSACRHVPLPLLVPALYLTLSSPPEAEKSDATASPRSALLVQRRDAPLTARTPPAIRRPLQKVLFCRKGAHATRAAGKEHECQYEENVQRNLTEALMARNRQLEQLVAHYEQSSPTASSPDQSNPASPFITAELNDFLSSVNSLQHSSLFPFVSANSNGIHAGLSAPGPVYMLSSPEPDTPSTDISSQSDHFSLNSPTLQELSEFRSTFLSHHGQLGVSFPEPKMRAILDGDISGTYAHPVLIYVAQLMGCRLWQEQHRTVLNTPVEFIQLQFVEQALLDGPDPVTRLQVHSVLAIYFLIKRQMHEGRDQLLRGAQTAVQYGLRFDSHTSEGLQPLADTSDIAQEHICALSQLMYLDKAAAIVLNDPSLLSAEYDQQFRRLPYIFPTISKNNLVVLRARSVALLQASRQLSARWTEFIMSLGCMQDVTSPTTQMQWYEEYFELLDDVSEQISTLTPTMLKTSFFHHREETLALKMCLIISLTAAAELHRLLAYQHPESRVRCVDVVFEIVAITKGLQDDDYIFLDPILGTCWSMVATVLNQERISPLDETLVLQWRSSVTVILHSASKLGHTLPFMEDSMETINGVASLAEESPKPMPVSVM
ncbi:hypothetical protein IEO21_09019 [Rhodonia placenta]|uniref:Transcription factor domain-containing protein n=1 Tax=Rhodonia placenta TaxID=104341 RepID=A0A8H7NV46_9APHY|nr:hypothetical protein IEO21_09019 [Postia placenta]